MLKIKQIVQADLILLTAGPDYIRVFNFFINPLTAGVAFIQFFFFY